MKKMAYCVSLRDGRHAWSYNRRTALACADRREGATVYAVSYGYLKDCHFSMDYPTVAVVGERIR